jgi:hypothetical protein
MKTTELIINGTFILFGLVLLVAIIRHPRAFFIEFPLGMIKFLGRGIKEELFIGFFLALFGLFTGKDVNNEYKTKRKRFLIFSTTNKFLLTTGTDEGMVKIKVTEGIESLNGKLKIEEFRFLSTSDLTTTIPPKDISFHDFNYLVQWLTDGKVRSVGLVEGKRLTYTVYDDPNTENLIGQTHTGETFFISLVDSFDKRQFLRINDEIEILEEYNIERIKSGLSAQQATII